MRAASVTAILIMVVILLLVAYDIVIYYKGGVDATISRVILHGAIGWPFVPFMAGLLCGHLFWSQDLRIKEIRSKTTYPEILMIPIGLIALCLFVYVLSYLIFG